MIIVRSDAKEHSEVLLKVWTDARTFCLVISFLAAHPNHRRKGVKTHEQTLKWIPLSLLISLHRRNSLSDSVIRNSLNSIGIGIKSSKNSFIYAVHHHLRREEATTSIMPPKKKSKKEEAAAKKAEAARKAKAKKEETESEEESEEEEEDELTGMLI